MSNTPGTKDFTPDPKNLPTTCLVCGRDALIWADDLSSVKCSECGQCDINPNHPANQN